MRLYKRFFRMFRVLFLFVTTFTSLNCSIAHASNAINIQTKPLNIAVVQIDIILEKSTASNHLRKNVEKISATLERELTNMRSDLERRQFEIANQKNHISIYEYNTQVTNFTKETSQAYRYAQNRKSKIEQAYAKAMEKIESTIKKIITEFAIEKGFDIAISQSQVLYFKESIDISHDVVQRLNAKLPIVNFSIE